MKKTWMAAAGVALMAVCAQAQQTQIKPENQIKLRKSAYALMNYNFDTLAKMSEGKLPFNKEEAVRRAELVAMIATTPKEFFGQGTGSEAGETRAKPEIWQKKADFDGKMDKMVQEASKLPQVARGGDAAAIHKQVNEVEQACKACHDDYRVKRN